MEAKEMLGKLEEHPGMNHENMERVADLLFELASVLSKDEKTDKNPSQYLERALLVYKYIESEGNVYSIDRNHKMEEIRKRLS